MTSTLFGKRLIGTTAIYGASAAGAKALSLLAMPYLTRSLGPIEFGTAELATSTAALLTVIAMFSGDIPAARFHATSAARHAQNSVLSSYVATTAVVSVLIALALAPAAGIVASSAWAAGQLTGLVHLSLILVPVSAVQAALAQTLRIQGRATAYAITSFVDLFAQLSLAVLLVSLGFGPSGVVLGFVAGSIIGLAAAGTAARHTVWARPSLRVAWGMLTRGIWLLPGVTGFLVADWFLRSVLANAAGADAVANFGLATRVASVVTIVGAGFAMAWGPVGLARIQGPETAGLFGRVTNIFGLSALAGALSLGALGPELVFLVAGSGFEGSALLLPGFAVANAITWTQYTLVVAAGVADRPATVTAASVAGAAIQVGASWLIVSSGAVEQVGLIVLLGRLSTFLVLWWLIRDSITLPLSWVGLAVVGSLGATLGVQLLIIADPTTASFRWLVAAGSAACAGYVLLRALRFTGRFGL